MVYDTMVEVMKIRFNLTNKPEEIFDLFVSDAQLREEIYANAKHGNGPRKPRTHLPVKRPRTRMTMRMKGRKRMRRTAIDWTIPSSPTATPTSGICLNSTVSSDCDRLSLLRWSQRRGKARTAARNQARQVSLSTLKAALSPASQGLLFQFSRQLVTAALSSRLVSARKPKQGEIGQATQT